MFEKGEKRMRGAVKIVAVFLVAWSWVLYGQADVIKTAVGETFNQSPFEYELRELERRQTHTVYAISYPSPVVSDLESNNTVHGEFFLPHGLPPTKSHPAVVINHILAGGFDLERMMCTTLANNGVVAMFIMMPYYERRGDNRGRKLIMESSDRFIKSLEQGIQDNRRAVDVLASRPEVAAEKIGIGGGSLGAIVSASVCGFEPRLERAFLLMGGGNLEQIFRHESRETAPFRKFLDSLDDASRKTTLDALTRLDPVSQGEALHRLSRFGRLRMICASEDHVIPPACSRALAEAAGCTITWLPGVNHYTVASQSAFIFAELVDFFTVRRPSEWKPVGANDGDKPEAVGLRLLGGFLRELSLMLAGTPTPGCGHHLGVSLAVDYKGGSHKADIQLKRGARGWYALSGNVPKLGQAAFGQAKHPWMAGAKESLYVGSQNAVDERRFDAFIAPEQLLKYQMATGALASVAMAPEILTGYTRVATTPTTEGMTRVAVDIPHPDFFGRINLVFDAKGALKSGFFSLSGVQGTLTISEWRLDAETPETDFAPPAGRTAREVNQEDVLRMIAAIFNRLLESVNF
jgi:dienelactone hydrolase